MLQRGFMVLVLMVVLSVGVISAQDADESVTFTVHIENIAGTPRYELAGTFDIPVGSDSPALLQPSESYSFMIPTFMGERLSFVTMLAESNDLFIAPNAEGIDLYTEDGDAPAPDITPQLQVWDLGTEVNEPFGAGDNQALRQSAPNTGDSENGVVRLASELNDDMTYPIASDIVDVSMVQTEDGGFFTVTITNISDQSDFPTAITAGVWALDSLPNVFFTPNEADYGYGLEMLAEDGDHSRLAMTLLGSDLVSAVTSGVWVVDNNTFENIFFTEGEVDYGDGLESLAEDGNPALLADYVFINGHEHFGVFTTPVMTESPAPILPTQSYEFSFSATPEMNLHFVTMLAESNDIIFASHPSGIRLFDDDGNPISGEITRYVRLWDVGTEINEALGEGGNQAPRQPTPNTGEIENSVVLPVTALQDGLTYPPASSLIRVLVSYSE